MASSQRSGSFIEQARRAQIVDCAVETIAEVGYGNASLAQIAKRAGISKGVISYHFAGKDELVQQVLAESMALAEAEMMPRIEAGDGPLGRLRGHIEGNIAFIKAHPKHLVAMVEILNNAKDENGEHVVDVGEFVEPGRPGRAGVRGRAGAGAGARVRSAGDGAVAALRHRRHGRPVPGRSEASIWTPTVAELVTLFELAIRKPE